MAGLVVADHEAALARTPGIDRFCSSTDWVIPAHQAFAPDACPLVLRVGDNWALLAEYASGDIGRDDPGRVVAAGLEPIWGFACPIAGAEPEQVTTQLAELAMAHRWHQIVLPGFDAGLGFARRAAAPLAEIGATGAVAGISRQVAHVDDPDQWWGRRSPKFRRNLRRAGRAAREAGLTFHDVSDDAGLVDRLVAIEGRSWKGRQHDGLSSPELAAFYRAMVARLQPNGDCRALVARLDGDDVGYILGAIRGRRYRGLQLSYVERARSLSLGHLLQREQMERLTGRIDHYDLGMDMAYKEAWADDREQTVVVVCQPALR